MYRYHHDLLAPGLPNNKLTVQSDIHNYNTRQALDLHIDPTNTEIAENTIKTQKVQWFGTQQIKPLKIATPLLL